ncbi:MAG: hypothetical protein ACMUHX_02425 [bacterium]
MKKEIGRWCRGLVKAVIIILFIFLASKANAKEPFGPKIVDVTTRAFSVVWTITDGAYTSCGIRFFTNDSYDVERSDINPSQIIIETDPGYPGEKGKQYGLAKVNVVGLNNNTKYYFKVTQNDVLLDYSGIVVTEMLRGLSSTDPGQSDIVSNDIVHRAVYKSDSTRPAIGALVLVDIYAHDADLDIDPPLSDYPISAWVGDGMGGDESSTEYNPDNISYKQYAAINMNNLFGRDKFPLNLQGDDPSTPMINEGEIIKFYILNGEQDVLGQDIDKHWFISCGRVDNVDMVNGEKITTAKISASFKFKEGVNAFAFPLVFLPSGYTTENLWNMIEAAEGKQGIVESIYVFEDKTWIKTYKAFDPILGSQFVNITNIQNGRGLFIILNQGMTKEVTFYGKPVSVGLDLYADTVNVVSLPQLPLYYETGNLINDIESSGAGENSIENIWFYDNGWKRTYKINHPVFGVRIKNSVPMSNSKFYVVKFREVGNDLLNFDPFETRKRSRIRSSNLVFFYE